MGTSSSKIGYMNVAAKNIDNIHKNNIHSLVWDKYGRLNFIPVAQIGKLKFWNIYLLFSDMINFHRGKLKI